MQFNIIQKVTMTCPLCNSSVTLNVPKNDTELEEMLHASTTLKSDFRSMSSDAGLSIGAKKQ